MITLNLQIPETVAAEFYQAADDINKRFRDTGASIEAKALMAFTLARHDADDVCAQFDLALRLVRESTNVSTMSAPTIGTKHLSARSSAK